MARWKSRFGKKEEALLQEEQKEKELLEKESEDAVPWDEAAASDEEETAGGREETAEPLAETVDTKTASGQQDKVPGKKSGVLSGITARLRKNEIVPSGQGEMDGAGGAGKGNKKKRKVRKLTKKQKIVRAAGILAIGAAAVWGGSRIFGASKHTGGAAEAQRTATVQKMDITSSLSSSGTLSPKDTYSITSLVSGEVISADFEEGDQVEEGQVLYVIDATSMESELSSAQSSLERAQETYDLAAEEYDEAVSDYSGNTYKSTESGYIKTLYVKAGDKVSANTKLADVYNDKVMKLRVPFLNTEASGIGIGNQGLITLSDTGEQLAGTVIAVANMEESLAGGRLVRYVTLQVDNPGGLTTSMAATVQIGDYLCAQEGTFEATLDTVMNADIATSVEIASMLVNEGDYISKGSALFKMTDKTAESLIRSYKDTMDNALESLENAQTKLDNTQDNYEDYTITAPISGQVITKSVKAGDNVNNGSSSATTLAVIYDLSELTFEMSVDELDVQSVKVGQTVEVTADAYEGQTFTGEVTNVSLASSYSNGVTNYPVTVTLTETGDLLPGMNVDGVIILEEAKDTLAVPVDALMRGNRVYVKDDSVTESNGGVPAGFRAVEVETGLMNDDYVEIKSGLSEGDEVYVAESSVGNSMQMMPGGMGGMGGMGGGPGGDMGGGGGNRGGGGGAPGGGGPR